MVAGIPVVMSIRESFFQTNSGVDPITGLVAGGEQVRRPRQLHRHLRRHRTPSRARAGTIDRFWNAFLNTTAITVVCVILETILGVAMALIMAKAFRGRGIVRAGILVPWAIPTIVSALMWKLIFDSPGVMNRILGNEILWLADTGASFWAIVIADTWKTAPFIGLLTLAGLQTIPAEVLRGGEGGRGDDLAAVRPDHPAAGQADAGGRGALPHARHPADVRPALRHDRRRQVPRRDAVDLLLPEATQTRYGPAAAYAIVLFLYVLLVAFVFVKVLGADVIGDTGMPKKKKGKGQNKAPDAVPAPGLEMIGGAH